MSHPFEKIVICEESNYSPHPFWHVLKGISVVFFTESIFKYLISFFEELLLSKLVFFTGKDDFIVVAKTKFLF